MKRILFLIFTVLIFVYGILFATKRFYNVIMIDKEFGVITIKKANIPDDIFYSAIVSSDSVTALIKVDITEEQHTVIISSGGVEVSIENVNTEAKIKQSLLTDNDINKWKNQ